MHEIPVSAKPEPLLGDREELRHYLATERIAARREPDEVETERELSLSHVALRQHEVRLAA